MMNAERMRASWDRLTAVGPRPTGSKNNEEAANLLLADLRQFFPQADLEEYSFEGWQYAGTCRLSLWGEEVSCYPMTGSNSTPKAQIEGELFDCGYNYIWGINKWKRYGILDHDHELAGFITVRSEYGAIPQVLGEGLSQYPHFIVGSETGKLIAQKLAGGEKITVQGEMLTERGTYTGRNVVALLKGPDKPKLIITAHYDTMFNTIGAFDNAAGVCVALELMKILSQENLALPVELVLTDSEEWNLVGSRVHAKKQDPAGVEFVLNIDGVGRGGTVDFWTGGEQYEGKLMKALQDINYQGPVVFHWPAPPGSDHAPYYEMGIPVQMITVSDKAIIHSPEDICREEMFENMQKVLSLILEILRLYGFILPPRVQ